MRRSLFDDHSRFVAYFRSFNTRGSQTWNGAIQGTERVKDTYRLTHGHKCRTRVFIVTSTKDSKSDDIWPDHNFQAGSQVLQRGRSIGALPQSCVPQHCVVAST